VLATLAQDILLIPTSGVGVECLFNCARDICHYRQGYLNTNTIKELILQLCAVKFEVEQREIDFTKELVLAGKAVMIEQDRGSIAPLLILDLISDNKEEEGEKEEEAEEEEEEEEEEKENRQEPSGETQK
jgi:hypothetical protein